MEIIDYCTSCVAVGVSLNRNVKVMWSSSEFHLMHLKTT